MNARWMMQAGVAVVAHPSLWGVAVQQMWRLGRGGWWRSAPFLPVPSAQYLRFRMVTAYGDPDAAMDADDLVTYLRWCKAWPALTR